jgi:hypothetical protein
MSITDFFHDQDERWKFLLLSCFVCFGLNFSNDSIFIFRGQFESDYIYSSESSSYNFKVVYDMLEWGCAVPNMILPYLVGIYLGKTSGYVLLPAAATCIFLGQFICYLSYRIISFPLRYIIIGRMLLVSGGYSIRVIINTELSTLFEGKELAFSLAINQSASIAAILLGDSITPYLATDLDGVVTVLAIGAILCALSAIVSMASLWFRRSSIVKGLNIYDANFISGDSYFDIILLLFTVCACSTVLPFLSAICYPKYYKAIFQTDEDNEDNFDALK